ncbi:tRNA methyltransferase TRMD/TRM10-type domain-containing protein, partial [Thamnocephalis sphaerospora]
VTLVLDCAYDDLMMDKEVISLCSQIGRCYAAMRSAACPPAGGLVMSSYGGRLADQIQQRLKTADRWRDVRWETASYDTLFSHDKLVYLSADAETEVTALEPDKVYVIGGLVDKNRHKSLTHQRAVALGVTTARLPIDAYVRMTQRRVLTVNHVVEILLKWGQHRDWQQAFLDVIPAR